MKKKRKEIIFRQVYIFNSLDELKNSVKKQTLFRNDGSGFVYVIEYGKEIKIGSSKNLFTRLCTHESNIRILKREKMGRIAFCGPNRNYKILEKHLHLRFYNKRISDYGELFSCRFEKACDALREEPDTPFEIEASDWQPSLPGIPKRNRFRNKDASRFRNTIKHLFPE